ncbi:Hsp20/alpha crystallin family protein [Pseudomonas cavernicola]|uniref:Hsp20/alpha crystallin family protein n=1 Tax=Pseudomonas cavernicola TaxID=2320866 RepID=A0A418XNC0_9PSED|nr:Hsp20/alpha crystallin family protein [Pseudomonas cavernicola]RJG13970.1 Hsp20/alpha crystallin family protein [Pseudomonas cavernicola]
MNKLSELKHGLEETWNSLSEGWRHLRDRTNGALTRFTPSAKATESAPSPAELQFPPAGWALLAGDLFEDNDKFVVRLEAPGLDKQDFDLEVRSDVLIVRGEKRYAQESGSGRYRVRQCAFGSFHRSIPLPIPVIAEKATANYRNGVLRIELPKAEHAGGRRIEVRPG